MKGPLIFLAERVGFEPTKGYKPLLVFKTSAFNRSATSPCRFERVRIVLAVSRGFNLNCGGFSKISRISRRFACLSLKQAQLL